MTFTHACDLYKCPVATKGVQEDITPHSSIADSIHPNTLTSRLSKIYKLYIQSVIRSLGPSKASELFPTTTLPHWL